MVSRRLVSVLLALLLTVGLAPACSSDDDDADGADSSHDAVETLAAAGITVFADPEDNEPVVAPSKPASPVQLLEWQALSLGAATSGLTAAQLDDAVPGVEIGEYELPTSALITGWAEHSDTPAAESARRLLAGPPDWPEDAPSDLRPVYSDLVLLLFASDVAAAGAALSAATEESGQDPATAELEGQGAAIPAIFDEAGAPSQDLGRACQTLVGFTANVRAAVINALENVKAHPDPVNTGFGPFDVLVNAVVQGAAGAFNLTIQGAQLFVDGVFQATMGEVLQFVARIAGVVGTLAEVGNLVKEWTVTLQEKDPEINQMGVRPAEVGLPGQVTLRVSVNFDRWPLGVTECAEAVGRPLPNLKPEGNQVSWTVDGFDIAIEDERRTERTLDQDGTARLSYLTGVEDPPEPDAEEQSGIFLVHAHVSRDDITQLQQHFNTLVVDALTGALPLGGVPFARDLVASTAKQLLTDITAGVAKALAMLRDREVSAAVVVRYHTPGDDEPGPPTAGSPGPSSRLDVCGLLADQEIRSILGFVPDTVSPTSHEELERELQQHQAAGRVGPDVVRDERIVRADVCEKGSNFSVVPGSQYETAAGGTIQSEAFEQRVGWGVHTFADESGPRDWIAETLRFHASLPPTKGNVRYVHLDVGDEAIGSEVNEVYLDGEVWQPTGKVIFQGCINFRVGRFLVSVWGNHDHVKILGKDQMVRVGQAIAAKLR